MKKLMESGDDELVQGAIEEIEVGLKVRIVITRPSFFTCPPFMMRICDLTHIRSAGMSIQ